MAYEKIGWVNHIVEYPFRRSIEDNGDGTYIVKPDVGEIIQRGTKQSAENFNHMDDGIADLDRRVTEIEEGEIEVKMNEAENEEIDEVFDMTGSDSPYPADWVEASSDDIDALFN